MLCGGCGFPEDACECGEAPWLHAPDCEANVGFYAPAIPAPCTCGATQGTNLDEGMR